MQRLLRIIIYLSYLIPLFLRYVLFEQKHNRVLRTQPCHTLLHSFLYLLPSISFSLFVYVTLVDYYYSLLSPPCLHMLFFLQQNPNQKVMVGFICFFESVFSFFVVVSPLNAEADESKGKPVRLSIMEETRESRARDSIISPSPRLSDSLC